MADIIGHPWMQGEVATKDEIIAQFTKRYENVKINRAKELAKSKQKKAQTEMEESK